MSESYITKIGNRVILIVVDEHPKVQAERNLTPFELVLGTNMVVDETRELWPSYVYISGSAWITRVQKALGYD